ncbi:MAG: hypothetical protein H6601_12405 [Flavobacteriales bacterium]|nr:hypothetical protein [Flavobacteriales bacterium]
MLSLSALTETAQAQSGCPVGFEMRDVKCKGEISKRCMPINYECRNCWYVRWEPCPGGQHSGLDMFHTYEKALEVALSKRRSPQKECFLWDENNFSIYLQDESTCSGSQSSSANEQLKTELVKNARNFYKRIKELLANTRQALSRGYSLPGDISKEYWRTLQNSERKAGELLGMLTSVQDHSFDEINRLYEDLQKDEVQLQQINTDIQNAANGQRQQQLQQQQEQRQQQQQVVEQRTREADARREEQLRQLNAQSRARAEAIGNLHSSVSSSVRKSIDDGQRRRIEEQNRNRESRFAELRRKVQSEDGELVNCYKCGGNGGSSCSTCRGAGSRTCNSCQGNAGKSCRVCNGSGVKYTLGTTKVTCSSCFGKGKIECSWCHNTGNAPCTQCDGVGKSSCYYCAGTGLEFRR